MIQFTFPWALLSLVSIPIIVLFHMLRPKRRTVLLSSTAIWHQALRESRRGLGLQKLLRDLSLILLLLFALLLSLALADPHALTRAAEGGDAVLIFDVSASMKAAVGGDTRFALAKQQAAELIDALPRSGRMLIMTSGRHALLRSAFESDKEILHRALADLQPTDEAGRPQQALSLAASLLRNRESGRAYFFTDGAFDQALEFPSSLIEYRRVGGPRPARNVAITRFDIRPEVGTEDRFQVLLTLRSYIDESINVPTTIDLDRQPLFQQTVRLAAGGEQTLVLPFSGRVAGRQAESRIEFDDDLVSDNRAYAVMNVDQALRVLLISEGNFYLESALTALPNVEVTLKRELIDDLDRQTLLHDVVVFDRIAAPQLPPGSYLLVDTVAPDLPFSAQGAVVRPSIKGVGSSALMRHLDLTGVRIDRARRLAIEEEPPGLQRLFWSEETVLALALLHGDVRLVFLGFDLARSNFPLQAAFPLLVGQSLEWLRPASNRFAATQLAAGQSYLIQMPGVHTELIMRTPAGDGKIYPIEDNALLFSETSQSGIYRFTVAGVHRYFAVNLADEDESDIESRAGFPDPGRSAEQPTQQTDQALGSIALWPYLLMVALAMLALEWCLCRVAWAPRWGNA